MRFPGGQARLWLVAAGFIAWSVVFVVLYAVQATGCRLGWHETHGVFGFSLQRVLLVVLFLGLLAGMAALALWLDTAMRRARAEKAPAAATFLGRVGRDAGVAALVATVFTFVWVFWLAAC